VRQLPVDSIRRSHGPTPRTPDFVGYILLRTSLGGHWAHDTKPSCRLAVAPGGTTGGGGTEQSLDSSRLPSRPHCGCRSRAISHAEFARLPHPRFDDPTKWPPMELTTILPALFRGAMTTLEITLLAGTLGFILSSISALASLSKVRFLRLLNHLYVELFRGTSLLVQLFFFFYVLPTVGISMGPLLTAVIALALNASAYGSEVIRSAIKSVDHGQLDAAASLNMSYLLSLRRVIIPQARRIATPSLVNQLVQLLISTSLVSLITVTDLAFAGQQLLTTTGRPTFVYTAVLVFYFLMAYPLSRLAHRAEYQQSAARRPWEIL
jgi:polar amino acid transport system permease protein